MIAADRIGVRPNERSANLRSLVIANNGEVMDASAADFDLTASQ
jgi:hypothetical protein